MASGAAGWSLVALAVGVVRKLMATTAVTASCSPHVLCLCDGLDVRGVDAPAVATEVVEHQPIRYWSERHLVKEPVNSVLSGRAVTKRLAEDGVAAVVVMAVPEPTTLGWFGVAVDGEQVHSSPPAHSLY